MTKTESVPSFWLESARLVLKKHTALYVHPETGLPLIDQEAAHEFVCSLNEEEIEWLAFPSVQERLRLWQERSLDRMECVILDVQTANVLVTVHGALGPENRDKFIRLSLKRAVTAAWRCVR